MSGVMSSVSWKQLNSKARSFVIGASSSTLLEADSMESEMDLEHSAVVQTLVKRKAKRDKQRAARQS